VVSCCTTVGYYEGPDDGGGGLRNAFMGEDYSTVDWLSCSVTIVSSSWEVTADCSLVVSSPILLCVGYRFKKLPAMPLAVG
jgi:hypothetical protein